MFRSGVGRGGHLPYRNSKDETSDEQHAAHAAAAGLSVKKKAGRASSQGRTQFQGPVRPPS